MEPSDEELLQAARDADLLMPDGSTGYLESADLSELVLAFARAVLAHWGNYPAQPGSSPAPPARDEVVEPVAEGPTDEELLGSMPQQLRDDLATVSRMAAHGAGPDVTPELFEASLAAGALQFVRVALARYSHQSAPPAEGEGLPSDQEIADVFSQGCRDFSCSYKPLFLGGARAILARWGHPAPAPAPATEGEVGELVEWLKSLEGASIWFEPGSPEDRNRNRAADLLEQHHPAPPTEGEVAELVAFLLWHASGLGHYGHGKRGRLLLTRAANLLSQRHPAPVPEEAANPWKDALIDALVCNFLLTTENESDPKKALHDLISWETRLAMDPSINPLMRPVPVSERLPGPGDCDGERNCWQWIPDISGHLSLGHWELQHRDWVSDPDGDATHWLPATALPLPAGEVQS